MTTPAGYLVHDTSGACTPDCNTPGTPDEVSLSFNSSPNDFTESPSLMEMIRECKKIRRISACSNYSTNTSNSDATTVSLPPQTIENLVMCEACQNEWGGPDWHSNSETLSHEVQCELCSRKFKGWKIARPHSPSSGGQNKKALGLVYCSPCAKLHSACQANTANCLVPTRVVADNDGSIVCSSCSSVLGHDWRTTASFVPNSICLQCRKPFVARRVQPTTWDCYTFKYCYNCCSPPTPITTNNNNTHHTTTAGATNSTNNTHTDENEKNTSSLTSSLSSSPSPSCSPSASSSVLNPNSQQQQDNTPGGGGVVILGCQAATHKCTAIMPPDTRIGAPRKSEADLICSGCRSHWDKLGGKGWQWGPNVSPSVPCSKCSKPFVSPTIPDNGRRDSDLLGISFPNSTSSLLSSPDTPPCLGRKGSLSTSLSGTPPLNGSLPKLDSVLFDFEEIQQGDDGRVLAFKVCRNCAVKHGLCQIGSSSCRGPREPY
eukprot:TRINITY_DN57206_c0_g1_i1.p1 TRINITY_DN57206_c0_g1~~TRINITY_DN57206_c0_g1_i1.p1  ORF type:complete len:488 (+),score=33.12 TRINITY_DN57206_c0_g1_i1:31-1494(+)